MLRGEDNQARPIQYKGKTRYSERTIERKGFAAPINLRYEGDFHRGIRAEVRGEEVRISSTDEKNDKLVRMTSDQWENYAGQDKIFGLNEYSLPIVRENGQEKLIKKVKEKLQL